jgi:O-antigen ligase
MYARFALHANEGTAALTGKVERLSTHTRKVLAIGVTCSALLVALSFTDVSALFSAMRQLSLANLFSVVVLLLCGALLASARLAYIAADLGYRMRAADAIAALSLGQLGGAIFLQLVGQVIARSAVLVRRGVPVAATVAVTGYERLLALLVSLAIAFVGGWYLFGQITVDLHAGGAAFLRLAAGGLLALAGSAAFAWGRPVARFVRANMGRHAAWRIMRSLALSLLIQACTMASYVAAAKALAPQANTVDVAAASAIIMLAASVPISLAGWGVRELGAIYVLGAIGLDREIALLVAMLIGATALGAVAILAAMAALARITPSTSVIAPPVTHHDVPSIIAWVVPILATIAVFFQVHLPLASSPININVADPLAIVAAALFGIECIQKRRLPAWRLPWFNVHLLSMTALLALAFLHGWTAFGITAWALTNRLAGWFVLLSYLAAGALIVARGGREGFILLLRTFIGAAVTIVALDLLIYCTGRLGLPVPEEILTYRLEGFAQNPNAFALQLVLALIATFLGINTARLQTAAMGVLFIGLWFSGSRSGFIAVGLVLVAALALRAVKPSRLCAALLILILTALIVDNLPGIVTTMVTALHTSVRFVASLFGSALPGGQVVLHPPKYSALEAIAAGYESSNAQRIASLKGGWAMFTAHPIFGAGLGAFMESYTRINDVPLVIHSTLLWFLAEMGVIGLLVFIAPFVRVFKNEVYAADRGDPARIFLILALLGFGAFAVVHDIAYQRSFWLVFGAAMACTVPASTSNGRDFSAATSKHPPVGS